MDFTNIFKVIAAIVAFEKANPNAMATIIEFAKIVQQIIAAFNPPTP